MNALSDFNSEVLRIEHIKELRLMEFSLESYDQRFEQIVKLAQRIFNLAYAAVAIVDQDYVWLRAYEGELIRKSLKRHSLFDQAILHEDVFVVEDNSRDNIYHNHISSEGIEVNFFASQRICTPDGCCVGVLFIADPAARVFNQQQAITLSDLAAFVENEIADMYHSAVDQLTGIANRLGFCQLAEKTLSLCCRENMPVSLVVFDINDLKAINDIYGYEEGNKAIDAFVNRIQDSLRVSDILARIKDDEFVALLINTPKESADVVISRAQKKLNEYNLQSLNDYNVTFSFGTVEYQQDTHASLESLLEACDSVLHQRRQEEALMCSYDPEIKEMISVHLD